MSVGSTTMNRVEEKVPVNGLFGCRLSGGHFLPTFCPGIVMREIRKEKGARLWRKETKGKPGIFSWIFLSPLSNHY